MAPTDIDGFARWGTDTPSVPVLLSVPHAGRDYPSELLDALRLPPAVLLRLEDRYADMLTRRCVQLGYHEAVADVLEQMRQQFGVAILLDLHSMPPIRGGTSLPAPQFVIGDRFGKSAASRYAELLMARLRAQGFNAALNHPYAGAYILRRHARPGSNIHAIQLEVDRSLYLDSDLRYPGVGFDCINALISNLVSALVDEALGSATLIAAE